MGGGARVFVPADATALSGGDWLVLRIDPAPLADLANGFEGASNALRGLAPLGSRRRRVRRPARARRDGCECLRGSPAGGLRVERLAPAAPYAGAGSLPADWSDGYYVGGSDVHILHAPPRASASCATSGRRPPPTQFAGVVSAGALTLSWQPGSDSSGLLDRFSVYADGAPYAAYDTSTRSASLGVFTAADARVFTMSEATRSNTSARTGRLRALPDLAGLTESQARAAWRPVASRQAR